MIKSALFGLAVGDALGVPVEFQNRRRLALSPVAGMQGYGTHGQPPGTWSDDSSLAFCLADALCSGYHPEGIAGAIWSWLHHGFWAARGEVFDVGIATSDAIGRMSAGIPWNEAGGRGEYDNGNGALMRILPLVFYIQNLPVEERLHATGEVAGITHAHPRSTLCCHYYLEFARALLYGDDKWKAYRDLQAALPERIRSYPDMEAELPTLNRLLSGDISKLEEPAIQSSGYVVHTLEAAIWCLLTTEDYAACALRAVNLGEDTDTTASVAGGLAGILYGYDGIPAEWTDVLAKKEEIALLAERLEGALA